MKVSFVLLAQPLVVLEFEMELLGLLLAAWLLVGPWNCWVLDHPNSDY